jgi:hypothetical protein
MAGMSKRSMGQRARTVTRKMASNLARSKGFGGKGG